MWMLLLFALQMTALAATGTDQETIDEVKVEGLPVDYDKRWIVSLRGSPIDPALIAEVESRLNGDLKNQGYACPDVDVSGVSALHLLQVKVKSGPLVHFSSVVREYQPLVSGELLKKYYPFTDEDLYQVDLTALADQRVIRSGVAFSSYFSENCDEKGVPITHRIIPGEQKQWTIGVGLNTEVWPVFLGQVNWSRVDHKGSSILLDAQTSLKEQQFKASWNWYVGSEPSSRFSLLTDARLGRYDLGPLTYWGTHARVAPTNSWDFGHFLVEVGAGPGFEWTQRLGGAARQEFSGGMLEFWARAITHDLELQRLRPTSGTEWKLATRHSFDGVASTFTGQDLEFKGRTIWSWPSLMPSPFAMEFRYEAQVLLVPENGRSAASIPPSFQKFLGGSKNIRGYDRNELSGRTTGYLGVDAKWRIPRWGGLDLIAFWDTAWVGHVYTSPGVGAQWFSPFGDVKGSIARGLTAPEHWQLYLSLGKEM